MQLHLTHALSASSAETPVAVCRCGYTWTVETPLSWWLKYDRCDTCMRDEYPDIEPRCLTEDEMRPFIEPDPPAPLPRSDPRRLP